MRAQVLAHDSVRTFSAARNQRRTYLHWQCVLEVQVKDKKTLASWLRLGWDSPETLNYTPHVHVVPVVEYLEKGLHTFLSLGGPGGGPRGPGARAGPRAGGGEAGRFSRGTRTEVKSQNPAATSETKLKKLRVFRPHPILRNHPSFEASLIITTVSSRRARIALPCPQGPLASLAHSSLAHSSLAHSSLARACLSLPCGPMACTSTACFLYPPRRDSCP